MSLLKRLHSVVKALGGVGEASVGLVADLITAPFDDKENDGIVGTLYDSTVNNGTRFLGSTIGPEGIGGNLIGILPEWVKAPGRDIIQPIERGLETTYREGIAEPVSTLFTYSSLVDGSGMSAFDPRTLSRAYRIAQERSPGQSLALSFQGGDITDEAQLAIMMESDFYKRVSGLTDATARFFLDPTVIGGKAAMALRAAKVTKPIKTAEDIVNAINDPRTLRFSQAVDDIRKSSPDEAAAKIRDRFFPDHDQGALYSTVYAQARSTEEVIFATKAFLGDQASLQILRDKNLAIHDQIASLNRQMHELGPIKAAQPYKYEGTLVIPGQQPSLFGLTDAGIPGDVAAIRDELSQYYAWERRVARQQAGFGTMKEVPRVDLYPGLPSFGNIRTSITRSDFYQNNTFGKTLQSFFHKNAHPVLNASDNRSDIHVDRSMAEAGLPQADRDLIRSRYMAAPDQDTRVRIIAEAEDAAVNHIAAKAGMSVEELATMKEKLTFARTEAKDLLSQRVFNADGSSFIRRQDEQGNWTEHHFPPWMTQDAALYPMLNMRALATAASDIGRYRARFPGTAIPGEILHAFERVWKPAVLFRPAWPMRVVGDEQFRIIATIGALSHFDNLQSGVRDYTSDFISSVKTRGLGNTVGKRNRELRQEFGVREIDYKGIRAEGAFGAPDDINRYWRGQVSGNRSFEALVGSRREVALRDMREVGQNFKSISPDHPDYAATYDWALDQLRRHPISNRLLNGESADDVMKWLQSTPEGSRVLSQNSIAAHNIRNWVEEFAEQTDKYIGSNDELRALAASGKASHADLIRLVPDESARPIAHAEVLRQVQGKGFIAKYITSTVERIYDKLGRLPSDTLSRNPFFRHMYEAELKRRIDLLPETGDIDEALKNQIIQSSREFALNETQKLLYDFAEQSRFGEILGTLSPFYNAWEEVITRWAGITVKNPAFIARAMMVWDAPEKMGLITDEYNNPVKSGETYSDDPTATNFRGGGRYLNFPVPDWATNIPGFRSLDKDERIRFNRKSLNLVLQGFPGAGVPVQIAVNEIVKRRPEWADSVKAILPFGPVYELEDMVLPTGAKYIFSGITEDERMVSSQMRIFHKKLADVENGKRDRVDAKVLWEEAISEAESFMHLRGFLAYMSPVSLSFISPYQPQLNAFRQAQARYQADKTSLADSHGNPRTPDEWFLDEHGEEYFALTQSVTRTLNGVPPTMEAYEKQKEYQQLIEEYPDFGGLIIGADGAGEFNRNIYNHQLNSSAGPMTSKNQRERIPFEEVITDPDRRLGWIKYRRIMDRLDTIRIQRGLPNMQVSGAADLAFVKSQAVKDLGIKYPSWLDDYNQTDKGAWDKKIAALRVISAKPEMQGREDMKGITAYLRARDAFTAELAKRKAAGGAATLTASSNAPLAEAWRNVMGKMIQDNLAFSEVYYRYLENDPLGL